MQNRFEMPIGEPTIKKLVCLWCLLKKKNLAKEIIFSTLKIEYGQWVDLYEIRGLKWIITLYVNTF